jgi:hypothetical protein
VFGELHGGFFQPQQKRLARLSSTIAGQRAIRTDHPVAGHNNRKPVMPVGQAHGATGAGFAELQMSRIIIGLAQSVCSYRMNACKSPVSLLIADLKSLAVTFWLAFSSVLPNTLRTTLATV